MADEQDKWLDRETAERLLRGESLEAVDPCARDQAERLSRALGALSAEAAPATGELPGEQSALAAFRKAREAAEAERTAAAHAPSAARAPASGTDAGPIRIAGPARTGIPARRPLRARPARLAFAAVLAVGTLGGVAVAAGSGVLPTPFGDDHPRPAASVTAGTTTGQPLASPVPPATVTGPGAPGTEDTPDGRPEESVGSGRPDDGPGPSTAPGSGTRSTPSAGTGWLRPADACRALRDGKGLDAGRRRALEHLAGGPGRTTRYCEVLLTAGGHVPGSANGRSEDAGKADGSKKDGAKKDKGGKGDQGGKGGRDGDGGQGGKGGGRESGQGSGGDGAARRGHGVRHRGAAVPGPGPSAGAPRPGGPEGKRPDTAPGPASTALRTAPSARA
ncbi:hypothetical protein ACH4JS_10405 [Streptomyces sp. NPDC017638]|uniref:hypothetical protein n=1 Tax=Streptomyces sp. NPDC017638 TaxID=3365004 RepID=UPI00378E3566